MFEVLFTLTRNNVYTIQNKKYVVVALPASKKMQAKTERKNEMKNMWTKLQLQFQNTQTQTAIA